MAPSARKWPSRENINPYFYNNQPVLTNNRRLLPVAALAHYTAQGCDIAKARPNLGKAFKALSALGLINRLGNWLDHRTLNNSVSDPYNWHREVVILTGGSTGIGRRIAELLGARDIKVAILDITPPATDDVLSNST
ncbi:hypothetical protein N7471_010668 [Penicillium samsonianum]|uniref:uncharacterized protein n=1 Tax=Penicillium samsonianum TaxID=1882272 RepID=UPI0025481B41|nr:uncharacterized protein N7471_010668 [Penicillium samsonianum]KAJ6126175.1 hypothetical protein N7471_010668 [Penicillium samsonianum]